MQRRSFLIAALGASGTLLVGCGDRARQQLRSGSLALGPDEIALDGWLKLARDGSVTAVIAKSEMGQGVQTALMMLVAEELDCAWSQMRWQQSGVDRLYGNVAALAEGLPLRPDDDGTVARSMRWVMVQVMRGMGIMMTGGSSSVKDLWLPMRQAAAVARATLVAAAARQWSVPAQQLSVSEGVIRGPGQQRMGLGEAVALLGPSPQPAAEFTLKTPAQFKLIGRPLPRNDAADKVHGRARFGIDVQRPGMLYAAIRMAPSLGGSVSRFDGRAAAAMRGVRQVLAFDPQAGSSGGVAVLADRYWHARQALQEVQVQWNAGPAAALSSADAMKAMAEAIDRDDGFAFWKLGDAAAAIAAAPTRLEAEYSAPFLAHQTMEPMNCTIEFKDGRATVWAPTQVPGFARRAAAQALGIDEEHVDLQVTYLGGGFGRRLEADVVGIAAAIASQAPGAVIQVLWSREEDTRHDFYRPACMSRFQAGLDAQGRIVGWRNHSAGPSIVPGFMLRNAGLPAGGPDKTSSEGAFDQAYEFPAAEVSHTRVELPLPVGFWRAVGHSHQAFFKEGFLDECASAAKADPYRFRAELLDRHPRQRAVLDLAAQRAQWQQPPAAAADGAKVARGIALHESFGSIVAQVAEVSIGPQRQIRVHRVVCAIDCGIAVNPNLIAQQIESAVIFGLSAALHGGVIIERGQVQQSNFHDQPVLRFNEAPLVETHIVPSTLPPDGVGEPGLPPIAPAVAGAVFALTGQRLRSLPLKLLA